MGYKNFSEICPIFNTDNDSGLEHEISFPYPYGSLTTSCYPQIYFKFGREVVVQEAYAKWYTSTTCFACVSQSQTIGIYKTSTHDMSVGATIIGSIPMGSTDMTADAWGNITISGNQHQVADLTSTAFTSTDILALSNVSISQLGRVVTAGEPPTIVIRYREK